jgi:hypothetical protein
MHKSFSDNTIIGGMFGLQAMPDSQAITPPFIKDQNILFTNVRSGIWFLVDQLAPSKVWCPSYLCQTILNAVKKCKTEINFYEMNYDLAIASLNWLDEIEQGDLVILIDYFGFNCDPICAKKVKERGAWVLEDASQALLSTNTGQFSDFVLYNLRKFIGVPDGGVLWVNCDIQFNNNLVEPPADWWLEAFSASLLRREFDIHGGTRKWFDLFRKSEVNAPIGPFSMSELSRMLMLNNFNYSFIAQRRKENYKALAAKLGRLALFPDLHPNAVPLGFPIRIKERDKVKQILFDHQIYPPVHWSIDKVVPLQYSDSHRLASDIMTLPCDQRYNVNEMERMAQLILENLN